MARTARDPIHIFYAYAPEDEALRLALEKHLALLRQKGIIIDWHERQIVPGTDWAEAIDQQLEQAALILLLISSDFLASDYHYSQEMQRALERHERKKARVVPILLRPVDWQGAPFAHLLCLPRNRQPVTSWQNQDEAFVDIAVGITQVINDLRGSVLPAPRLSGMERANRSNMLGQVRACWIRGVLDTALADLPVLTPTLREMPDAVANPWREIVQETDRRSLPATGTGIVELYDEVDGGLLLLGEPGAGKTIHLLQLTRELLARAETDTASPLPVVFSLASWGSRTSSLVDWLVEELEVRYRVSEKIGRAWIAQGQLLPLLDGLDEVRPERRAACVRAINYYRQEYPLVSLVVCSRKAEYLALGDVQLELQRAFSIAALETAQVEAYLTRVGAAGEAVQAAILHDPQLQELVTTPLMLNVLVQTFQGVGTEGQLIEAAPELRQRIFGDYARRMLERRSKEAHPPAKGLPGLVRRLLKRPRPVKGYSAAETFSWLSWMARQMVQRDQRLFLIEQLQPVCLIDEQARATYQIILTWAWLCMGALVGLLGGVALGQVFGATAGVIGGCVLGVVCLQVSGLQVSEIEASQILGWSWRNVWTNLRTFVTAIVRIILYILLLPFLLLAYALSKVHSGIGEFLSRLGSHLNFGELFGGLGRLFDGPALEIMSRDSGLALRHLLTDLLFNVVKFVDLIFHGLGHLDSESAGKVFIALVVVTITQVSLITWLFLIGMFVVIVGGLSSRTLPTLETLQPNEGIWRSVRQAVRTGLVVGLTFALLGGPAFSGLFSVFAHQPPILASTVSFILLMALAGLLLGFLRGGGSQCIKHGILRLMLLRENAMPWDYPRFLEDAASRILLHRVGGSYIFAHRPLLDYFANREGASPASAKAAPAYDDTDGAAMPSVSGLLGSTGTSSGTLQGAKGRLVALSSFAQNLLSSAPAEPLALHGRKEALIETTAAATDQKATPSSPEQRQPQPSGATSNTASAEDHLRANAGTPAAEQMSPPTAPTPVKARLTEREKKLARALLIAVGLIILESIYIFTAIPSRQTGRATEQLATPTLSALQQLSKDVKGNETAQAQVAATRAAFNQHLKQLTSLTPTFVDTMTSAQDDQWDVLANLDSGDCHFSNGAYHATVHAQKMGLALFSCFARKTHFANFVLQVQVQTQQDGVGGVYFRCDLVNSSGCYTFSLSSKGAFALYAFHGKTSTLLLNGANVPLAKNGQNQLSVVAQGKDIDLYVNGDYVGSVRDQQATSTSGSIGVLAGNNGISTYMDVAYTNVEVWG